MVTLAGTAPGGETRRPGRTRSAFSLRWADVPALARVAMEGLPFRALVRMVLPSVTIVTPAGSDLGALERTVASVSRQGYAGYQHVIVDRGLAPGVRERAQAADEAGRVTVVEAPGAAEFEALREGLGAAIGEYVAYLPAGSVLLPAALKNLARQLVARPRTKVLVFDELVQRGHERRVVRTLGRVSFDDLVAGQELRPECVVFRRSTYGRVHGLSGGLGHAAFLDLLLRLSKRARFVRGQGHFGVAWERGPETGFAQSARQERESARRYASARLRIGQRARLAWWRLLDTAGARGGHEVEAARVTDGERESGSRVGSGVGSRVGSERAWAGEPSARCPVSGEVPEWFVGTLHEPEAWVYRSARSGTMIFTPTQRGEVLEDGAAPACAWCEGLEGVLVPAVSVVARRALGSRAEDEPGRGIELASAGLAGVREGLSALGWRPVGGSVGVGGQGVGGASLVLAGDLPTRSADVGAELARLYARAARGGVVVVFAPNAGCEAARRGSWEGLRAGAAGRRWLASLRGWRLAAARAGLAVRAASEVLAFGDPRGLIVVAIGEAAGRTP